MRFVYWAVITPIYMIPSTYSPEAKYFFLKICASPCEKNIFASLYIYHFLTLVDSSSEKYSGSTLHRKLLVPVEKCTVRMPMVRLELATARLSTECFSHRAKQLKSYCWEGVEFIQLVYCIIIYSSFLNCG